MIARDLAETIGVSIKYLYSWNRSGYLRPGRGVTEYGRACTYTPTECAVAARMAAMVNAGVTAGVAHAIARGDLQAAKAVVVAVEDVTLEPVLPPAVPDAAVADQAVFDAMDICVAVRDVDPRDLWPELEAMAQDQRHRLLAALVALAAMVPVERPVSELLAWTDALDQRGAA